MAVSGKRYRAFISYSQKDREQARRLQRAMESFEPPKGVVADGLDPKTRRLGRFFRDEEDLGAAADLTETLQEQIASADCLIVVCSPHAAQSVWVDREIIHFKRTGRADRIFAVIVDGEPNAAASNNVERRKTECFPPALKVRVGADGALTDQPEEPLAIDLRKDGFARGRARLAAGMLDVNFDDLWRRDQRRARGRAVTLAAVSAVGAIAVVAGGWGAIKLTQQADDFSRFSERAKGGGQDALAETRRVSGVSDFTGPRQDDTVTSAQMRAAALAYALTFSGQEKQAAPLLQQLGYVRVLTLPDAGNPVVEPGWTHAVAGGLNIKPALIDLQTGTRTPIVMAQYTSPVFSPDNRWMATGADDSRVIVWDLVRGSEAWTFKQQEFNTLDFPHVGFDHKGKLAAIGSRGELRLVELATGNEISVIPFQNYIAPTGTTDYDNEQTVGVVFSLDDTRVHVDGAKGRHTWDLPSQRWLPEFPSAVDPVLFTAPGFDAAHVLFSATRHEDDLSIPQYIQTNIETGKADTPVEPAGCPADAGVGGCVPPLATLSRDRRWVAWGQYQGKVADLRLFDLAAGKPPVSPNKDGCTDKAPPPARCFVQAYAISPSRPEVAFATSGNALLIADMASGAVQREMEPFEGMVANLSFSDAGDKLVGLVDATNYNGSRTIWLWDVATGKVLSRSGIILSEESLHLVKGSASELLLVTNGGTAAMWRSIAPAGETPAEGLKRLCAWRGGQGLKLDDADLALLPRHDGRSNDVCQWKLP